MHISWEDKKKNIDTFLGACRQASEKKVEFLLFPEMTFTGFSMNTEITAEWNNESIEVVKDAAREYYLAIGFGWTKAVENNKCENHYTVVSRDGEILSDYTKIHPFSYSGEDRFFVGGVQLSDFCLGDTAFSGFICYDLRFPEVFQAVSKKAHVVFVPADWPKKRRSHWKTLLRARAIENQVYILGVNCVGSIGGIEYSGDSRIISPNGDILKKAKAGKECLITYDLTDDVDKYRESFPVKKDRREKLYYSWTDGDFIR